MECDNEKCHTESRGRAGFEARRAGSDEAHFWPTVLAASLHRRIVWVDLIFCLMIPWPWPVACIPKPLDVLPLAAMLHRLSNPNTCKHPTTVVSSGLKSEAHNGGGLCSGDCTVLPEVASQVKGPTSSLPLTEAGLHFGAK